MVIEDPDRVTGDADFTQREEFYRSTGPDQWDLKVVVHYRPVPPQGTCEGGVVTAHPTKRVDATEVPRRPSSRQTSLAGRRTRSVTASGSMSTASPTTCCSTSGTARYTPPATRSTPQTKPTPPCWSASGRTAWTPVGWSASRSARCWPASAGAARHRPHWRRLAEPDPPAELVAAFVAGVRYLFEQYWTPAPPMEEQLASTQRADRDATAAGGTGPTSERTRPIGAECLPSGRAAPPRRPGITDAAGTPPGR